MIFYLITLKYGSNGDVYLRLINETLELDIEKISEILEQWQEEEPEIKKIKEDQNDQKLWNRLINDLILAKEAYHKNNHENNKIQVIVEDGIQIIDVKNNDVESNKFELVDVIDTKLENLQQEKEEMTV